MNINSHILKLSGKAELPKEIDISHNYHVSLEGSITGISIDDNEDGTYNKIYKFKPVKVDLLTPQGEQIKLKDPRKNSVKIRNKLYFLWKESNEQMDFDEYYTRLKNYLTQHLEEIITGIK